MAKNNSNFIVKFSSKPPVKSNSRAMVKAKPKTTKASATVHESQQTAVVYKDGKTAVMRQKMKVTASKDGLKTEKIQSVKQRVPTTSGKRYQTMTMTDTIEMSYQEVACHMHMIASCSSMGGGSMHMLEN